MKLYDFNRLINKYSVTFQLRQKTGKFVGGKWEQSDEQVTTLTGAIVPMNDRKVYNSGGTFTSADRELYITQPLPLPMSTLEVLYKERVYKVEEARDFEDYADAAVYNLKYVSAGGNKS